MQIDNFSKFCEAARLTKLTQKDAERFKRFGNPKWFKAYVKHGTRFIKMVGGGIRLKTIEELRVK